MSFSKPRAGGRRIGPRSAGLLGLALAAALGSAPAQAAIPATERQALLALYDAADGPNWRNSTGKWTGAVGTECSWHGVTCSGSAGNEHVTGLKLNFNNLKGTVPASITDLTELSTLNLYQNELSGPLPPLDQWSRLVTLILGSNKFSGPIPPLAGLAQLETFEIRGAQLTGSTPELGSLKKLKLFMVDGNQLDGQIGALAGATALDTFRVDNNRLTGAIPDLTGLTSLRDFTASNNRLTSITTLAGLANLYTFQANANRLSGAIPPLTGLGKLYSFYVNDNQLSGPIPDLTGLSSLVYLHLQDNQLGGVLPPSLSALPKLRFLHVQNNRLVGAPPMPPGALEGAAMCPNPLRNSADAAINAAWDPITNNGRQPWATNCTGSWDVTPVVRDAASGEIIIDGHTGTISPASVQILPKGGGATFTLSPAAGYRLPSQLDTNCPGVRNGNTYAVQNIQANCSINAAFVLDVPGAIDGVCGSDHGTSLPSAPVNLCTAGAASAVTGTGPWNWSCTGTGGGATAQCSAQKTGSSWVVTAVVDGNGGGSAAPATQDVSQGARAGITATPQPSYMLIGASGCGASFSGNAVTTAPVTADCTVTLSFALAQATTTQFISVAPAAPRVGEDVAVRVAVEAGDTPVSGGAVTVSGGGASCTATLDAAGAGQCSLRFGSAGTHQLTAAYPGDPAQRLQPSSAVRDVSVTGSPADVQPVPTLGEWALALLAALMLMVGLRARRAG